jgi:hypothetical protein
MSPMRTSLWLAMCLLMPVAANAARGLEPRDLVALDRYSSPTLSTDGRVLVFAKRSVGEE